MFAGALRHQIDIERLTLTGDGRGGSTRAWASVGTVRASIKPLRGVEREGAQKIESSLTHKVTIRGCSALGVTVKDRVKFGSRILRIHAVIDIDERGIWIELMTEELT